MAYTVQDYGFVQEFLNRNPDLAREVQTAIDTGMTPDKFQQRLKTTSWWRTHADAEREFDVMLNDNPAQAQALLSESESALRRLAAQMGISFDDATMKAWARNQVTHKYVENDMRAIMAGTTGALDAWMIASGTPTRGEAGVTVDSLRRMAADYGIPASDATLISQMRSVLSRNTTVDQLSDYYREQAKRQYASIAPQLDQGYTVRQAAQPYLDLANEELKIHPDQMDLRDPKWTKFLNGGEGGKELSLNEWRATLRSDKQYGWDQTPAARELAMSAVSGLAQAFGRA